MLERWLAGLRPVTTATNGTRTISGARLFEEGAEFDPAFVYVGRTGDFFPSVGTDEVVAVNGNDVISFRDGDVNHTFNMILDAFDYYDEVERRINLAPLAKNPEQEIISAFEELLGPTFIMGKDYRIIACSRNFEDANVNKFWGAFASKGEPELNTIPLMRNSVIQTRVLSRQPSMLRFREPEAVPYDFGLANTYRKIDGSVIGHLIIASDRKITRFEFDIAQVMVDALNSLQARSGASASQDEAVEKGEILFANLLDDSEDARSVEVLGALYGINESTRLICLRIDNAGDYAGVLAGAIGRMAPQNVTVERNEGVAVLLWDTSAVEDKITPLCSWLSHQAPLRIGMSNPFTDLRNCAFAYGQALYATPSNQGVGIFADVAVDYLLTCSDARARQIARHPLVVELERADIAGGSQLVSTLREYLLCERSVKAAASRLFVHKNTVMYRIGQIKAYGLADLDDVGERNYLLLSLLV